EDRQGSVALMLLEDVGAEPDRACLDLLGRETLTAGFEQFEHPRSLESMPGFFQTFGFALHVVLCILAPLAVHGSHREVLALPAKNAERCRELASAACASLKARRCGCKPGLIEDGGDRSLCMLCVRPF